MTGSSTSQVGLPPRPFLYSLDQVADLVAVDLATLRKRHVFYDRVSPGIPPRDLLLARNIAADSDKPVWRVAERELLRWLRYRGFRVHSRGWLTS